MALTLNENINFTDKFTEKQSLQVDTDVSQVNTWRKPFREQESTHAKASRWEIIYFMCLRHNMNTKK